MVGTQVIQLRRGCQAHRTHNDEFFDFENATEGLNTRQISIKVKQFAVSSLQSEVLHYAHYKRNYLITSFAARIVKFG